MKFTKELHLTTVGYLYVSEHHLMHTGLKACMRDVIRANRPCEAPVLNAHTGLTTLAGGMVIRRVLISQRSIAAQPVLTLLIGVVGCYCSSALISECSDVGSQTPSLFTNA